MSGTMRERLEAMLRSGLPDERRARFQELMAGVTVTFNARRGGFVSLTEVIHNGAAVSEEIQRRGRQ